MPAGTGPPVCPCSVQERPCRSEHPDRGGAPPPCALLEPDRDCTGTAAGVDHHARLGHAVPGSAHHDSPDTDRRPSVPVRGGRPCPCGERGSLVQVSLHVLGDPPRDALDVPSTGEDLGDAQGQRLRGHRRVRQERRLRRRPVGPDRSVCCDRCVCSRRSWHQGRGRRGRVVMPDGFDTQRCPVLVDRGVSRARAVVRILVDPLCFPRHAGPFRRWAERMGNAKCEMTTSRPCGQRRSVHKSPVLDWSRVDPQ